MSAVPFPLIFQPRNFLGVQGLNEQQLTYLLDCAEKNLPFPPDSNNEKRPFKGKTQINLFFENSTRTQSSFEIAGKKLGLDVLNIAIANSSIKKGETLLDTLRTLNAMKPDIFVVRHSSSDAARFIANHVDCPVVNAGDGTHEHPTQALLDALTIRRIKKSIKGLKIVICGDILHSRVARSNIISLHMLGAQLRAIGPSTLIPYGLESFGVEVFHDMQSGLKDADVIIMLRLQQERMDRAFIPSLSEYAYFYGLTEERLKYAKPDCIVMHPGPVNRGVEITSGVINSPQTVIEQQVTTGVAVRMAILEILLNATQPNHCR